MGTEKREEDDSVETAEERQEDSSKTARRQLEDNKGTTANPISAKFGPDPDCQIENEVLRLSG